MSRSRSAAVLLWTSVVVIVACAGLAAGSLAGAAARRVAAGTGLSSIGSTASPPASATIPTATATQVPVAAPAVGFSFTAMATPQAVRPGAQFVISLTAVDRDQKPLAGLQCFMRSPSDGSRPLFTEWPGPQVTDAQGHATWTLVAPQVPPGYYVLEIVAFGQHESRFVWQPGITIQV